MVLLELLLPSGNALIVAKTFGFQTGASAGRRGAGRRGGCPGERRAAGWDVSWGRAQSRIARSLDQTRKPPKDNAYLWTERQFTQG